MSTKKNLTTFSLFAASVSGMIGSGWLLGPLTTAQIAGPASIISWIMGGFLIAIIAACFSFLSKNIPTTGGSVRFFQISHGHFAGFSISWITWIAWASVPAIEALAVLQYSGNYIPGLMTKGPSPELTHIGILAGIALIGVIALINIAGVKVFNKTNFIILAMKLFIPIGAICYLFFSSNSVNHVENFSNFAPNGWKAVLSALPLAGVFYSFLGFNPAIEMSREAKDPKRSVPRALFLSVLFTTVVYSLLQIAFIYALPNSSYASGWEQLSFTGSSAPIAGLLTLFGVAIFVKILYLDAIIAPFGCGLVISASTSRMTCAMSDNKYLPKFLSKFCPKGTPVNSIIFNSIIAICFLFTFTSWKSLVGLLVASITLGYIVGPLALGLLTTQNKINFKEHHKKYIHALCIIALIICTLIVYWAGWDVIKKIGVIFTVGYIILGCMYFINKNNFGNINLVKGSWVFLYILGLCIFSYFGTFGGTNVIPFGIDILYISIFATSIYYMSIKISNYQASENTQDIPEFSVN